MNILSSALVILSAVCVGSLIGYIFGFAMSAHSDVMNGVRPRTNNRFLLFIARPTASFNFVEGIVFFFLMLAWLPIFFGLCAVPAIIGNKLGIDDALLIKVTYAVFVGVVFVARRYGAKAWSALV